jgi:hypothetical protein
VSAVKFAVVAVAATAAVKATVAVAVIPTAGTIIIEPARVAITPFRAIAIGAIAAADTIATTIAPLAVKAIPTLKYQAVFADDVVIAKGR